MRLQKRPFGFIVFEHDGTAIVFETDEKLAVDAAADGEGRWYEGLYRRDGTPLNLGKPSDIEVIAERLAKVEDRLARLAVLADNFGSLLTRLDAVDARLDTQSELRIRSNGALDQRINAQNEARHNLEADLTRRIDKVVEIIGERVGGLVDRLDKLEKPWEHQPAEVDPFPYPPGFPTGGAHTAEAASEAVLPVPQRGDRVRLEGAYSLGHTPLDAGWYDVVGHAVGVFQIRVPSNNTGSSIKDEDGVGLYFVAANTTSLKEVRHADHT